MDQMNYDWDTVLCYMDNRTGQARLSWFCKKLYCVYLSYNQLASFILKMSLTNRDKLLTDSHVCYIDEDYTMYLSEKKLLYSKRWLLSNHIARYRSYESIRYRLQDGIK